MTRFAEPMVITCPHCDGHLLKCQLVSFSMRSTKSWTDGATGIGFDNVFSPLLRCPLCRQSFWKRDAKEIFQLPCKTRPMGQLAVWYAKLSGDKDKKLATQTRWDNIPNCFKNAPSADVPDFDDWLELLEDTSKLTPDRELIVRRKVWRSSSDHLRLKDDGTPWVPAPLLSEILVTENLLALLELHNNGNTTNHAEKAELLRQLGRFDGAIHAIESASREEQQSPLFNKILMLAKSSNIVVDYL